MRVHNRGKQAQGQAERNQTLVNADPLETEAIVAGQMNRYINRRNFIKLIGAGTTAFTLAGCTNGLTLKKTKPKPPNFIIIFTDDQGYADLGCYGAQDFATTNIDRMAAEGMIFTDFYVSQAVCSASRAALLTGCYSNRVGILGALMPWSKEGISDREETIAEVLKKTGYATAIFGKWHLGCHKQFLPLQHGFDEYLGLPYSNDMWPVDYDGKTITEGWKADYPPLPLIDGNETAEYIKTLDDQATLTKRYTERAVKFIEKNKDKPFFLYVPHSMPHVPLAVSSKFKGKSRQGLYGDVIMEIDWSVGQILDTLRRNGLDENSLVIFASDNGPWLNFGNHAGSTGPLREGKGNAFEGGVRVPCVMRWPAGIQQNSICTKMAATIDILPTVAAIAQAQLPDEKIDGVNILPLLEGKNISPRNHYFFYYDTELRAVRKDRYKLYMPHKYRSYEGVEPGNNGYAGPYSQGQTDLALYDLEKDIGETTNIADAHPEIVKRLQALADKARQELGDSLTNTKGNNIRQCARLPDTKK